MLEQYRLDIRNGTSPNPIMPEHPVYYYECAVYDADLRIARICGETWQDNPLTINLHNLRVNPEYRNRLIGFSLMSMFLDWTNTTPASLIRLNTGGVPLDDNPLEVALWYEKHFGFCEVEKVDNSELVLELQIK